MEGKRGRKVEKEKGKVKVKVKVKGETKPGTLKMKQLVIYSKIKSKF